MESPSAHQLPADAVLETVLGAYRMRVEIIADVHFCGTWVEEEPAMRYGQFHLVTAGRCWVDGEVMGAPVLLEVGDVIVFPASVRHQLRSSDNPCDDASQPPDTWMLCGELEFITGAHNPIFQALPPWFVIRAAESSAGFRDLADMLAMASRDRGWGRRLIQNKLADSFFTIAVCEYVRRADRPQGLLAALADPRLSRVLGAVHQQPGHDWTLAAMAQLAGMSRTAFAELFSQTVGTPPIQYLAHWRATEARRLLRNRRFSVARVAEMLGYGSEAAFRRFFKRIEGEGPGKARNRPDRD
ncbi:MAG TPA: AraC family transcriptional regulator [Stenotrophomonas sp.]